MAVINTLDTGDPHSPDEPIHPRLKAPVALRFARAALRLHYGVAAPSHEGPVLASVSHARQPPDAWNVTLRFRPNAPDAQLRLRDTNQCRRCCGAPAFEVTSDAGETWAPAEAVALSGTAVHVTGRGGRPPVALRYAWQDYPECLLHNAEGAPAAPFTTPVPEAGPPP